MWVTCNVGMTSVSRKSRKSRIEISMYDLKKKDKTFSTTRPSKVVHRWINIATRQNGAN